MSQIHFYYGLDHPPETFIENFKGGTLVTQPYHPLSLKDEWRSYLPECSKQFYYFNCYKISIAEYQSLLKNTLIHSYDLKWDSVILDLKDPINFCFLRNRAEEMLLKKSCDGLFLDDLDCHHVAQNKDLLLELIKSIKKNLEQKFIVNRGFELWNEMHDIEAIVLESFVPEQFPEEKDLDWIEFTLNTSLKPFRENNPSTPISILKYDLKHTFDNMPQISQDRAHRITCEIEKLNLKIMTATERLDQWPMYLS